VTNDMWVSPSVGATRIGPAGRVRIDRQLAVDAREATLANPPAESG
jgi:hypothetical protein